MLYRIERTETYSGVFTVEADDPEEALARFEAAMDDDDGFCEKVWQSVTSYEGSDHQVVCELSGTGDTWIDLPKGGDVL